MFAGGSKFLKFKRFLYEVRLLILFCNHTMFSIIIVYYVTVALYG